MRGRVAVVRGGGDLATGVIYRLWKSGFKVLALEVQKPLVVRRTVAAASAVFDGSCVVEDMLVKRISSLEQFCGTDTVAIIVDPAGRSIYELKPDLLVDAIMAKRSTGTSIGMAPLVVGLGPGFTAKKDVHYVVETKRGHTLGRLIADGSAIADTGIPGVINGFGVERLLRAPGDGKLQSFFDIGDHVNSGDLIARVGDLEVKSRISGTLRGLIHPSVDITKGLKIGDVDPRDDHFNCYSITDKALAIAGGVLEAVMREF